ncbi:serine/threonine-protein kinase [Nannocystis sp.]|uniref:serine/threonine-protein kinase n=1 Tax=Nannocystis sp. TaxID=1962667 RepID=UPI0025DC93E8|nr:serine/threonine-protein kinase [Nannocystis sp.]MBK7825232.1 serine/threonine protein kinase [Nannocystis sp.]
MTDASADPSAIGPFVVLNKLGEGAMGVVYAVYDTALDRKVALKLVRRQLLDKPAVRARMTREAQAMARLSNPHVVQVYQVGEHDGGIYVAMEYIDGETLGAWLRAATRSWQSVLRVVCEAGRGLAAAHSAGLVHRDFKPDNVLVDARGQARVLDFGLVQAEHNGHEPEDDTTETADDAAVNTTLPEGIERSNVHWSVRLTQMGKVLGTPAYMSPEQHFGEPSGPYSDQFSFAVTLYEALYGARPFVGDTWASIKAQVERGVVPPPPPESRAPRRLFKVVARGLATDPKRRFGSMDEMLAALSRDPGRARVRAAALVGLIGVASAGSFAAATMGMSTEERCAGGAEEIGAVWGEAQRTVVRRAFTQTGQAYAGDVLARAEARLDQYAEAWQSAQVTACRSHAGGSTSAHMLDLRNACLGRRKQHVAALVEIFAGADRDVVEHAVQAVAALPSVKACEDEDGLLNAVAPPDDVATAERVETLRERLVRARALEATGGYAEGLTLATKVRGEARTLSYAPLQAEAALVEGGLLSASARSVDAEAALAEALRMAIAHDLHAEAAEAAVKRIFVLGDGLARHEAALASEPFAAALVERARDDGSLAALLENNLGIVFDLAGDDAAAQRHFERTVTLLQRAGTPDPLLAVVHHNLANVDLERGDLDAAQRNSTRAYELFVQLLGERHPLAGHPLSGLGDVALRRGALVEARARYTEALALMEAVHGLEHPHLLTPLTGLGQVATRGGDMTEAKRYFERAVAIAERDDHVHPQRALALEGLGELAAAEGELRRALDLFDRAVRAYGGDRALGLSAALRAGEMAAKLGDTAAAIGWFEQVLAATPGPAKGDARRLTATLSLARMLAGRGEARQRVCDLLTEARAALAPGDERRAASEAAFVVSCGPSL